MTQTSLPVASIHLPRWQDGPLIGLPHRGNLVDLRCMGCGHEATVSGRDLIHHHSAWLTRSIADWLHALECSVCGGRDIDGHPFADPGAVTVAGRRHSEDGPVTWARRLTNWLAETGKTLSDVDHVLSDHPSRAALEAVGIDPGPPR